MWGFSESILSSKHAVTVVNAHNYSPRCCWFSAGWEVTNFHESHLDPNGKTLSKYRHNHVEIRCIFKPQWSVINIVWLQAYSHGSLHSSTCVRKCYKRSFFSPQHWINEFLTWNSSDFCGINMLTIPRSMLWIPDMHIQEEYGILIFVLFLLLFFRAFMALNW